MFDNIKSKIAAGVAGVTALTVATSASATGLGTIVSAEISSAKPEMLLVIGAMAGALVLLVVWGLVRRSMSK